MTLNICVLTNFQINHFFYIDSRDLANDRSQAEVFTLEFMENKLSKYRKQKKCLIIVKLGCRSKVKRSKELQRCKGCQRTKGAKGTRV